MTRAGIDNSWIRTVDDKFTFCGALEEFYEECAKYWKKDATRTQYDVYYNTIILPNLKDHDRKAIDEYTREDFDAAILAIAEKGQHSSSEAYLPYADTTIQKFRHLIEVVVIAAANHGLCENVLWGSCFSLQEERNSDDAINERVKLKKSLTVVEEYAVAQKLLSDVQQRGQEMGLLLMFALGLRNGEACGANYGDIKPMQYYPNCKVMWIYKATVAGSSEVKSSGKTRNADRIILIPDVLDRFIQSRRRYLEETVAFDPESDVQCVDDLPIACVGHDFFMRCSAEKLTAAGREMFRQIKMNGNKLAYIDSELSDKSVSDELRERDPTAYLLRRNFGTHLSILGLSESEIEYIIGHDINDAYETRNEFVNEERIFRIKQKLDQRPILNEICPEGEVQEIQPSAGRMLCLEGPGPKRYRFKTGRDCLRLHLSCKEPVDALRIRILRDGVEEKTMMTYSAPRKYGRTIDVLKKYHEIYNKV